MARIVALSFDRLRMRERGRFQLREKEVELIKYKSINGR